ncbi:hypothetical protein OH738_36605 [Streptomyces hirsutus]|uniref:Uncharacterized protein n=1 Tax=Streptomyces hirsutus TaxID=35620 RepID=A0ABZ1GG20_9ACTN|nr:hypothetical protein [Streptomyces hirsutus]WSD04880.1 hypothetical protein OIE73_03300 [Streptomyces hirsutus]WTD21728.1 hypothetical protein OH738_36605 [Streptomyces hirsutus]WTD73471.1 hypothetical protein OHB56_05725 [Streptomyces sp. NBC_01635]
MSGRPGSGAGPASVALLVSLMPIHLLPLLGSQRMNTFETRRRDGPLWDS